jgi:hypothetical protein
MLAALESFQLGGKNPGPDRLGIVVGVNAFHEKAGQCQEQFSFSPYLPERTASAAILPSALFDERFSLGASWAFSFQWVLPPDYRPLLHL